MSRVMIAGTGSGCGKTTIVCGILQAFMNRGLKTGSFKCGPDYIDPMFHSEIIGAKSRNLDGFFMDGQTMRALLAKNSRGLDISVIEGTMGYYDGIGMDEQASSCQIAAETKTPVILILPCKGMSRSIQAVLSGFLGYKRNHGICGVIFNMLPSKLYPDMAVYCEKMGVRPLGYFPPVREAVLESRHLGLVTAQEIGDLRKKVQKLAMAAETYLDMDGILGLAMAAGKLTDFSEIDGLGSTDVLALPTSKGNTERLRIAVARDRAFCFYYEDNLELLQSLGCELVEFSPLKDEKLPSQVDGLLLGGGYPELYGEALSANQSMLSDIRLQIEQGLPTHAECGGYMYLHRTMTDMDGKCHALAGVLQGACHFTEKLQHFGYAAMTAKADNLLCRRGEKLLVHEFHRCVSDEGQTVFLTEKNGEQWMSCVEKYNMLGGFPHIHYYANPAVAWRFVEKCRKYHAGREGLWQRQS